EADLAYTRLAIGNRAAMPAGVTTDASATERFVQFAFADVLINQIAKGRHRGPPLYFNGLQRRRHISVHTNACSGICTQFKRSTLPQPGRGKAENPARLRAQWHTERDLPLEKSQPRTERGLR